MGRMTVKSRARVASQGEGHGVLEVVSHSAWGTRAYSAIAAPPGRSNRDAVVADASHGPETDLPPWARGALIPWQTTGTSWPPSGTEVMTAAIGRGWPFIAVWCDAGITIETTTPPSTTWSEPSGGFPLPRRNRLGTYWADILPYRPVWGGLVANTAIYGGLWWLMLFVPPVVRHHLRLRRGHCPHCDYNLQSLTPGTNCPECGHTPARQGMWPLQMR